MTQFAGELEASNTMKTQPTFALLVLLLANIISSTAQSPADPFVKDGSKPPADLAESDLPKNLIIVTEIYELELEKLAEILTLPRRLPCPT